MVRTLSGLRGLAGFPPRKLRLLAERMAIRPFHSDAVIHDESQAKHNIYILLSGIARLTCLNRSNERVLLEVVGPGDMVAIPSLLPYARTDLRFLAFTDCRVGLLGAKRLVQDVIGLPFEHFSHALGVTCGRWWQLLMRHSVFMEQSLQERVALALLDLGFKVGTAHPDTNTFSVELTHQDLAHLVIGSRAKVTACLSQLAAQDAIRQEGRTRMVLVPERLQMMTGLGNPRM